MNESCAGCKWKAFADWLKGPANVPVPPDCEAAPCLVCPRFAIFRDRYTPDPDAKAEEDPQPPLTSADVVGSLVSAAELGRIIQRMSEKIKNGASFSEAALSEIGKANRRRESPKPAPADACQRRLRDGEAEPVTHGGPEKRT